MDRNDLIEQIKEVRKNIQTTENTLANAVGLYIEAFTYKLKYERTLHEALTTELKEIDNNETMAPSDDIKVTETTTTRTAQRVLRFAWERLEKTTLGSKLRFYLSNGKLSGVSLVNYDRNATPRLKTRP